MLNDAIIFYFLELVCKCNERIPVCLSVLSIFFVICPTILFFSLLYWNEHLQAKYRFNKVSGLLQWDGWCLYWHILIWIILIIYFCFIDYAKAFDCVNHNKLWKILKEMWIPDHLTCLFRNLYADQEATVRLGHGTIDWFQIGKGVRQGCLLSLCLLTLMQSTSWETLDWKKHKLESTLSAKYQ